MYSPITPLRMTLFHRSSLSKRVQTTDPLSAPSSLSLQVFVSGNYDASHLPQFAPHVHRFDLCSRILHQAEDINSYPHLISTADCKILPRSEEGWTYARDIPPSFYSHQYPTRLFHHCCSEIGFGFRRSHSSRSDNRYLAIKRCIDQGNGSAPLPSSLSCLRLSVIGC